MKLVNSMSRWRNRNARKVLDRTENEWSKCKINVGVNTSVELKYLQEPREHRVAIGNELGGSLLAADAGLRAGRLVCQRADYQSERCERPARHYTYIYCIQCFVYCICTGTLWSLHSSLHYVLYSSVCNVVLYALLSSVLRIFVCEWILMFYSTRVASGRTDSPESRPSPRIWSIDYFWIIESVGGDSIRFEMWAARVIPRIHNLCTKEAPSNLSRYHSSLRLSFETSTSTYFKIESKDESSSGAL